MPEIDVNISNIGIVGQSGSGKSFTFEKVIFPKLTKSMLLVDVKGQYGHLKKPNWDYYEISGNDPYRKYCNILKIVKLKFLKSKSHFIIRWIPQDINEEEFNAIVGDWTDRRNTVTILEESHYFKVTILRPFREFEKTMRLKTGLHNKNSSIIWITQMPNDMPKPIFANTQILFLFKHWDNVIEGMVNNRTIPDNVTFDKIIGKKENGEPIFNYHVIAH
jgi:hypothetical protein